MQNTFNFSATPFDLNGFWAIGYGSTFYENGMCVQEHDEPISEERAYQLIQLQQQYVDRLTLSGIFEITI